MDAILVAIKQVWDLMVGIGYDPIPTLVAVSIWFIGRERYVRPIFSKSISRENALLIHAKMKIRVIYISWLFAFLTTFAIKRSFDPFDIIMTFVWSAVHTAVASLLYQYFSTKKWMQKAGLFFQPKSIKEEKEGDGDV